MIWTLCLTSPDPGVGRHVDHAQDGHPRLVRSGRLSSLLPRDVADSHTGRPDDRRVSGCCLCGPRRSGRLRGHHAGWPGWRCQDGPEQSLSTDRHRVCQPRPHHLDRHRLRPLQIVEKLRRGAARSDLIPFAWFGATVVAHSRFYRLAGNLNRCALAAISSAAVWSDSAREYPRTASMRSSRW